MPHRSHFAPAEMADARAMSNFCQFRILNRIFQCFHSSENKFHILWKKMAGLQSKCNESWSETIHVGAGRYCGQCRIAAVDSQFLQEDLSHTFLCCLLAFKHTQSEMVRRETFHFDWLTWVYMDSQIDTGLDDERKKNAIRAFAYLPVARRGAS